MRGGAKTAARKRRFELPGIQQLTKDQDEVLALPLEGRHLVVGGPGTGKSVVALLRARRCAAEKRPYVFLVYNRLLDRAARQLVPGLESRTWESWFPEVFREILGEECPRLPPPRPGSSYRPVDWGNVAGRLADFEPAGQETRLVIDEGQDMPAAFYQSVLELGFRHIFVVADQNQRIVSGINSNRREIEDCLGLETSETFELKENWRNPYPVARLARCFYTGDPASPPPGLPDVGKSVRTPLVFGYRPGQFAPMIGRILKMADRNPRKLIGVVTPDNKVRRRYLGALRSVEVALDHGRPPVQTYESGGRRDGLDFSLGGVMVLNMQSCKGLEFDEMFLADIDKCIGSAAAPDLLKRRFYVMVARSRGGVFLLREAGKPCPAEGILPKETEILERYG